MQIKDKVIVLYDQWGNFFLEPFEAHVVWNFIFAKYLVSFLIGH